MRVMTDAGESGETGAGVDAIRLTELISARLCHDLAGALGAVASGAELVADDPDPETARMVATGAAGTVARLRLLRAALGPAGPTRRAADLRGLAAAYVEATATAASPLVLAWGLGEDAEVTGDRARLILTLLLVAQSALPRGGRVTVDPAPPMSGRLGLRIGFAGPGAGLDADTRLGLDGGGSPSGPRAAPAWWAGLLAARAKTRILIEVGQDGGTITL